MEETVDPNMDWYVSLSLERGVTPRCPFASVERCPRNYSSRSLLGQAGSTKIPAEEDDRLLARWRKSDLWPKTAEEDTSMSGGDGNYTGFSNFCPEVTYDRFGLFAGSLFEHTDEIDRELAHEIYKRKGGKAKLWELTWAYVRPLHFTECPLYSPLVYSSASTAERLQTMTMSKVFIVHGHDDASREAVARFVEKLGFEAIILHERPNKGRTIITKFREEAADVGFAIVLMTPDDVGGVATSERNNLNLRSRQNVVFELGFFIGTLGADRVAALIKGEIERPSDFDGVVYISLDRGAWKNDLARELDAAGYEFDWKRVT